MPHCCHSHLHDFYLPVTAKTGNRCLSGFTPMHALLCPPRTTQHWSSFHQTNGSLATPLSSLFSIFRQALLSQLFLYDAFKCSGRVHLWTILAFSNLIHFMTVLELQYYFERFSLVLVWPRYPITTNLSSSYLLLLQFTDKETAAHRLGILPKSQIIKVSVVWDEFRIEGSLSSCGFYWVKLLPKIWPEVKCICDIWFR